MNKSCNSIWLHAVVIYTCVPSETDCSLQCKVALRAHAHAQSNTFGTHQLKTWQHPPRPISDASLCSPRHRFPSICLFPLARFPIAPLVPLLCLFHPNSLCLDIPLSRQPSKFSQPASLRQQRQQTTNDQKKTSLSEVY